MNEKSNLDKFPPLSKELIEEINKLFPELSADLKWSEKEVWFRSGQRSIVRFLNSHYLKQQDNIMEK
ncbi:MAG: hypothetical protein CBC04_08605 [Verrucomicrobia bacterium TMED44]|mgnify:CR=1 FL=1|nr:MAG: hypothetical protein CBC04_08605 [Verrucomicrobia bacterium TMED44]|tara:strand:+ start:3734 stop:3934 length:201 start_codon:yes stop_codon:yes gene_type:complete